MQAILQNRKHLSPAVLSEPPRAEHRTEWRCGRWRIDLSRPRIMGIVNVTPDSFSDGGRFFEHQSALAHARRLIDEGADMLDIGGESTRPGAPEVTVDEELRRVMPVVESLADCGVPLSIDSSKPEVMRAALEAGAAIVNDVRALREPGALELVAKSECGVVLMHMLGSPRTMQQAPHYADVMAEVAVFLRHRLQSAIAAGISAERVVLDPGFGFGKSATHNLTLLARLNELALPAPILCGWSHKATLGQITGRDVVERIHASVAAAILAVERGASIVRVHDVAATHDALQVVQAVRDHAPQTEPSPRGQA
jgi:dihydropteroate synthase